MCGICGSFSFAGVTPDDLLDTSRMMNLMKRRGPDDEGLWTDNELVTLGFRRLSILDLSPAGHQPMTTRDGRYAIVYNGEVYNFRELRQELRARGSRFRSTGDSEVVLEALAAWGKAALNRFNGMFALAFYDKHAKKLLLARDHAGIKPLYYLRGSRGLVFASQYDQLMSHPWAKGLQVSSDALGLYLRLGYIPAPYGFLKDTSMVEPGSWLEFDREGRLTNGKYFQFPASCAPDLHGDEAWEAVDAAVSRAVRRHLVSDVPIGTFLSGGIDSPLVTAKAQAATPGSIRSFTIGTGDDRTDESREAAKYAREIGVEHTVEQASSDVALEILDEVVSACGEPFADYSIFPTMLIARLARREVKVILSGDGGDELFWGYPARFASVIERAHEFGRPMWRRALIRGPGGFFFSSPASPYTSVGEWYRAKHTRIPENRLAGIFTDLPPWPQDFSAFKYDGCIMDETACWLRWNEFVSHLTMVLLKVDRATMHHSLEARVPLLDREVIDVASRIDWRSCLDLKTRTGKLPLRKSLARHVSQQTHAKRGFEAPMNSWLKGPLKSLFNDRVVSATEIAGVPLDRKGVRHLFEEHVTGRREHGRALWLLLSLALWQAKHYRDRPQQGGLPTPERWFGQIEESVQRC